MHGYGSVVYNNYRASKIHVNKATGYIKGSCEDLIDYALNNKGKWYNYTFSISNENNIIEVRHHDHIVLEIDLFDKGKPKLITWELNKSCSSMYNGNSDHRAINKTLSVFDIDNIDTYYDDKERCWKVDYKENIEAWNTKRDLERSKNRERYYKKLRHSQLTLEQINDVFEKHIFISQGYLVKIINERMQEITSFNRTRFTVPEYTIDLYGNFIMKLIEWNEYNSISDIWLIGKDCYDQPWAYEFSDTFTYAHMSILYMQYALMGIRKRDLFETIHVQTISQRCRFKKRGERYCHSGYCDSGHERLKTIPRHDKPRLIMYS